MRDTRKLVGAALIVGASLIVTGVSLAADSTEVQWDKVFPGHEMWMTSLDSGLAVSAKDSRPMLIDFYSRL